MWYYVRYIEFDSGEIEYLDGVVINESEYEMIVKNKGISREFLNTLLYDYDFYMNSIVKVIIGEIEFDVIEN